MGSIFGKGRLLVVLGICYGTWGMTQNPEGTIQVQNGPVVCSENNLNNIFCSNGNPNQVTNPGNSTFIQSQTQRPGRQDNFTDNTGGNAEEEPDNQSSLYFKEPDNPFVPDPELYYPF